MRLGFPQPCFRMSISSAYCNSRRVLTAFCRPPVFPGQLCPAQDKGVQYLCFVGQGCECGCFKEEIWEPGEADRLFRLMNINRVCHNVFCGQLEARFPRKMILHTTRPGYELAKPDKSRLFSCLTVHSRPPFPLTFCFLPPVNSDGAVGAVFSPVGFWDEHAAGMGQEAFSGRTAKAKNGGTA